MSDPKPKRRHRYILIALLTIIIIPVLTIMIANIFFAAGAIQQEQLTPPAKLLTLKPAKAASDPLPLNWPEWGNDTDFKQVQKQYLDCFISRNPSASNYQILARLQPKLNNMRSNYYKHFNPQINGKYLNWEAGNPINADQAKWLRENEEFIHDLIRFAHAGGFPKLASEQISAIPADALPRVMNPYLFEFHWLSNCLAAESRRRQDAGDLSGSVTMVLALTQLAQSVNEPSLIDVAYSNIFLNAEFATMRQLLKAGLPLESATRLHDDYDLIASPDYRRQLEAYYRAQRAMYVQMLNGPFSKLFLHQLASDSLYFRDSVSDLGPNYLNHLMDDPFSTLGQSIDPALKASKIKSNASSIIAELDDHFAIYLDKYKPEHFWNIDPQFFTLHSNYENFMTTRVPENFPQTAKILKSKRNLELAGLDYVLGLSKDGSTTRTDPFTAAPLKVIQKENEIVIYSLGPDRKDQHATEYNENTQLGDISIRLPKHW